MAALTSMRYALYGLTLLIVIGGPLLATLVTVQQGLPRRPVLLLYACAACLVRTQPPAIRASRLVLTKNTFPNLTSQAIATVYKLVVGLHPVSPISRGAKAAFYLFNSLPELLCTTFYFAFDLDALFDVNEAVWKHQVEKKMDKGKWTGPYVSKGEFFQNQREDTSMGDRTADGSYRVPSPDKV